MSKTKYYVVWKGNQEGIYTDWSACKAAIDGFPGALYKGFSTLAEAEEAFKGSPWEYYGKGGKKPVAGQGTRGAANSPVTGALAVDAACSGNPGVMEYRGVWADSGIEYFRMGPYPQGTVNIGEFLAIVHGLALLKRDGFNSPLYTDSKTAMKWVKDKRANTKLPKNPQNKALFELMERAEKWLRENTWSNQILKWETREWGEIPADYGRK